MYEFVITERGRKGGHSWRYLDISPVRVTASFQDMTSLSPRLPGRKRPVPEKTAPFARAPAPGLFQSRRPDSNRGPLHYE
jgi:hypothetical protein